MEYLSNLNYFKAAIFDLDGTLIDSMYVWDKVDNDFLHKRGFEVPPTYAEDICACGFQGAATYTKKLFNLKESEEEIINEWNDMARYEYSNNVKLKPYAFEYLKRLKDNDIRLAIATALPNELCYPCLKNNKIYDLFDYICSTELVQGGKDEPEIYIHIADKLKVNPNECIVFEDVIPAMKGAKLANMKVYGVFDRNSLYTDKEIEKEADGYIYNFNEAPLFNTKDEH